MKNLRGIQPTMIWLVVMIFTMMGSLQAQDRQRERSPESCNHDGPQQKMHQQIPGPFGNYEQIPGITDKQKEEIKVIRIALLKDLKTIADQVNEKEARLRTLSGSEQYDSKAVEKLIDEIAVLQANKRKMTERARHQIRLMLNDEQKLWFDRNCKGHPKGQGQVTSRGKQSGNRK